MDQVYGLVVIGSQLRNGKGIYGIDISKYVAGLWLMIWSSGLRVKNVT